MKVETIREILFGTPWKHCRMWLSSGESLDITHPEWVFLSPTRSFLIAVLPNDSFRVIEPDHVVSLDVERQSPRATKKRYSA